MSATGKRLSGVTPVAIVGAGPYGLSVAAHLRVRSTEFRIFGPAMESWETNMPAGMLLKSEGFASNLSDPAKRSTLAHYCRERGLDYADTGMPVGLETIVSYGNWFQREQVPNLECKRLEWLERSGRGFYLHLDDGETLEVAKVVLAVGFRYFAHLPEELRHLPAELLSHSSEHHELGGFKGRHVTVIGGGSSALDLAALLNATGVEVVLVSRASALKFHSRPEKPTLWRKIRYPLSAIGPGWRNCLFSGAPMTFSYLPQEMRLHIARTHLGPAGAWWLKEKIAGQVVVLSGQAITGAEMAAGRVRLYLHDAAGERKIVTTDHIIAATGYKVDVNRLPFLNSDIRASVQVVAHGAPCLSRCFESSVPGLHFIGLASTFNFGPVMRFICGADHAARQLSRSLIRDVR